MKIVKSASIFSILTLLFGSCFNEPKLSVIPRIEFENVDFIVTPDIAKADTLAITISFKDGDGDLGFDPSLLSQTSDPFHETNFFIENNGELTPVSTAIVYQDVPALIRLPENATGKLVSVRTRKKPGYENLEPYTYPFNCLNYRYDSLYIGAEDKAIFEGEYTVSKVLPNLANPQVYILKDTFYYAPNPYHYNIDIDFLVKTPGDPNADSEGFVVYDWKLAQNCSSNFYARFPVLTDRPPRPLEGTLRYALQSSGLAFVLGGDKILKLKITIRDRALHTSNTVKSPEFKLKEI
jgi:hypothetical protein